MVLLTWDTFSKACKQQSQLLQFQRLLVCMSLYGVFLLPGATVVYHQILPVIVSAPSQVSSIQGNKLAVGLHTYADSSNTNLFLNPINNVLQRNQRSCHSIGPENVSIRDCVLWVLQVVPCNLGIFKFGTMVCVLHKIRPRRVEYRLSLPTGPA